MNCEEARRAILPLLYDELDPAEKRDVGSHLATCDGCAALLAEERRLLALLDRPVVEPAEELLQRCRRDLMDALAGATIAAGAGGAGARPGRARQAASWLWASLRLSPAFSLALLATGFLAGWMAMGNGLPVFARLAGRALGGQDAEAGTTSVSALVADPKTDLVRVSYDTLRRSSLEGSADDPAIRRLLVSTVRDSPNAGLRLDAIDALRRRAGDLEVRAALVRTVQEDVNPGARLKAIDALEDRARHDPLVRAAVIAALLKDGNPGVRVRAMDVLSQARDPEVLPVFERLAREDPNDYVRMRSAEAADRLLAAARGEER